METQTVAHLAIHVFRVRADVVLDTVVLPHRGTQARTDVHTVQAALMH